MNKLALADTGFWIGLLQDSDAYHSSACQYFDLLEMEGTTIVTPWAVLYEALSTRTVKKLNLAETRHLSKLFLDQHFADDVPVRSQLISLLHDYNAMQRERVSLVDASINYLLSFTDTRYHYLLTNNPGDFSRAIQDNPGLELLHLEAA